MGRKCFVCEKDGVKAGEQVYRAGLNVLNESTGRTQRGGMDTGDWRGHD